MDEPLVLEVGHAVSYLHGKLAQGRDGEDGLELLVLQAFQQRPQRRQLRDLERETDTLMEYASITVNYYHQPLYSEYK